MLQHLAPAPPAGQEGAAAELQCEHQPGNAPTEEREQQQQQGHDEGTPPAGRLPPGQAPRQLHVVDFGCGTGSLLLPLAAAFPHCHFTGVPAVPALRQVFWPNLPPVLTVLLPLVMLISMRVLVASPPWCGPAAVACMVATLCTLPFFTS